MLDMTETNGLQLRRAQGEDAERVAQLFERADVPCSCQYYQFDGDHRQWQDRCANHRSSNRQALEQDLTDNKVSAIIALLDEQVIGWARVARKAELRKLYDNRLYRSLAVLGEGEASTTFSISCFLVDPKLRRHGVARALLTACVELAKTLGASAIEAFPRGATDVSDGEQWTGPESLYQQANFRLIHDFPPYPVYRLNF